MFETGKEIRKEPLGKLNKSRFNIWFVCVFLCVNACNSGITYYEIFEMDLAI